MMMMKRVVAKNTTWHDVSRLKYAQIRPKSSFWCPPAFQLKISVKPSGNHYAPDQAKMASFTRFQILLNSYSNYFLNLNYKYWAYFSLNTSCHVIFLASTHFITIISLKIKVVGNFKLTVFFILGSDLENENASIKNNYIGSRNNIYNKIYVPIDP